jgi:hypothetical protein
MARPRPEPEARTVTLAVRVTPAMAADLKAVATRLNLTQVDAHRAALVLWLEGSDGQSVAPTAPPPRQRAREFSVAPEDRTEPHRHRPGIASGPVYHLQGQAYQDWLCGCGELLRGRRA